MKTKIRGVTLAAMLLTASNAAYGEQNTIQYDGDGYVTPVAYVGDVSSSAEDAYFAEDAQQAMRAAKARPSASRTAAKAISVTSVRQASESEKTSVKPAARRSYTPISASQLQPVGYDVDGGYSTQAYSPASASCCDSGCDGACDSYGAGGGLLLENSDRFGCTSGGRERTWRRAQRAPTTTLPARGWA